jgi:hypothetical protein
MHNRNQGNHSQNGFKNIQLKKLRKRGCIMTKEKWLEIIKLIASFAVGVATIVLAQSCISSWNINKNSQGATINSKQSAEQKNDSTNFKIELKK